MAADPSVVHERRFRVMGSAAHVVVDGNPALLDLAERRLGRLEARWSRFLPTSEVSRLNGAGGDLTVVSPETHRLVALAVEAWRATDGRFDPTVLGDVIRAGYDRTFEEVPATRDRAPGCGLHRGAGQIVVLPSASAVALPPGTGFDPGGIGKGLAADMVLGDLMDAGARGACVNVGGDLRVAGTRAGVAEWVIAIDPAGTGDPLGEVRLAAGAVATSTTQRRSWTVAGADAHHLIDPSTGRPADVGVTAVTVVADECWRAEVLAKAALVAGSDAAVAVIDRAGAAGIVVGPGGEVRPSAHLAEYLGEGSALRAPGTPIGAVR